MYPKHNPVLMGCHIPYPNPEEGGGIRYQLKKIE
jgi:hypothetical protein